MQQCLGLNYVPSGLLFWDRVWGSMPPVDVLMYDWMHIYLVHGCFQLEVSLLYLGALETGMWRCASMCGQSG